MQILFLWYGPKKASLFSMTYQDTLTPYLHHYILLFDFCPWSDWNIVITYWIRKDKILPYLTDYNAAGMAYQNCPIWPFGTWVGGSEFTNCEFINQGHLSSSLGSNGYYLLDFKHQYCRRRFINNTSVTESWYDLFMYTCKG